LGCIRCRVTSDRVIASYKLSFGASLIGAVLNVFSRHRAWVLCATIFPARKSSIAGRFALRVADCGGRYRMTALYAPNGWIGRYLEAVGIKAAFTPSAW